MATLFKRLSHFWVDHARLWCGTADFSRHSEVKVAGTKPDVEITLEKKAMATRFQRLLPTFSTTHDWGLRHRTLPDVGRHPKLKMAGSKPEAEGTFERESEMATQFQWYPHIFDYARFIIISLSTWPGCSTAQSKGDGNQTGIGN